MELRSLTGLRGICACWIVAFHFLSIRGLDLANNPLSFGFLAVDVFFVLSGFVLALAYGESVLTWPGYCRYLWRRIWRLFPLHVAIIAAVVAIAPLWSLPKVASELLLVHRWHLFPALEREGPATLGGVPTINGPDWSLSTEWAANLALPIFAFAILRGPIRRPLAAAAVCLGALVFIVARRHTIDISRPGDPLSLVRCAAEFSIGMLLFRFRAVIPTNALLAKALSLAPLHFLGRVSYALYLLHWPLLWFFGATFAMLASLFVLAPLCHWMIERPAREVGHSYALVGLFSRLTNRV